MSFSRVMMAAVLCVMSVPALAANSSEDWQVQLQNDLTEIQKSAPQLSVRGNVNVAQSGNNWVATLPVMTVQAGPNAQWLIDGIQITANNPQGPILNVVIQLPKNIAKQTRDQKSIANVYLAEQNLSGVWNMDTHSFQSLKGDIRKITYSAMNSTDRGAVDSLAIQEATPRKISLLASNIVSSWTSDNIASSSSVQSVQAGYTFANAQRFTLARLLGIINPALFMADAKSMDMNVTIKNLNIRDDVNILKTDSMTAQAQVQTLKPGKTVSARTIITASNMTRTPAATYSVFLPKELRANGTISALPLGFLNFMAGEDMGVLRDSMTAEGTRLELNEIFAQLDGKATAKGNGWLKADKNTPMGYVGRLNLTMTDLQSLATSFQQKMFQGSKQDMKANTEAFMIIMAVQGFAQQKGQNHDLVIDLTAEGQILVNGQDISALKGVMSGGAGAGMGGMLPKGLPAMPVSPVTGSDL